MAKVDSKKPYMGKIDLELETRLYVITTLKTFLAQMARKITQNPDLEVVVNDTDTTVVGEGNSIMAIAKYYEGKSKISGCINIGESTLAFYPYNFFDKDKIIQYAKELGIKFEESEGKK